MAAGSRTDCGANPNPNPNQQVPSVRVRTIIQSIKEIVGNHSDADIYAVLKESYMDPNETAQKLLNQDPFLEVKRRKDKKKELTGYRVFSDTRRRVEHNVHPEKSHTRWDMNNRRQVYNRQVYNRNPVTDAGASREFRVVRDNRVKQNADKDANLESIQNSASRKEHAKSSVPEKSIAGIVDQKQPAFSTSEGSVPANRVNKPGESAIDGSVNVEDADPSDSLVPPQLRDAKATSLGSNKQVQRDVHNNSKQHSTSSTNSIVGLYSSSSDPVHVPSPASKSVGTVGAIRRDVGIVGVRRQFSNHAVENSSVSNSSFPVPLLGKNVSSLPESFGPSIASSKGIQLNEAVTSESTVPSSRSFSGSQFSSKVHQQPTSHQKALLSTMEWKPKSSQKGITVSSDSSGTIPAPASSVPDCSGSSNPVDATNMSEKLFQVNILEDRHVVIPQHLRVPESEFTQLTFGSFGSGFDSTTVLTSSSQVFESAEQLRDGTSVSSSASVPVGYSGNASSDDQEDTSDNQAATSRSESPASAAESEQQPSGNTEALTHQTIDSYTDIGSVQNNTLPYSSPHIHEQQTPTSLPNFSAYDSQTRYHVPYLRTVMEDNVHGQGVISSTEAVSSYATNSNPASAILSQQQLTLQQQQQQALANVYPHVHISHFPNFMPYRQVFSPVYVPPMALPNYSSNPGYPHPNGSNYLVMPGGSSHVPAGGIKYAPSQYKAVPAGAPTAYGNYSNLTGFTISPPGTATGLDDASRMKYKDNLYVANPQAETSDIWIQTQRELPTLQSAPQYYNLAGQLPHGAAAAAFMPGSHASLASFNAAAQSQHVQYPGLYHPAASPASITGPHHLVHQSALGGNIGGVGVAAAAPGPLVGGYQRPQLGHLNWPANF